MTTDKAVKIHGELMRETGKERARLARAFPVGDPRADHLKSRARLLAADARAFGRLREWDRAGFMERAVEEAEHRMEER